MLDRIDFPNMGVYVGRGVGGGSLVNGGMAPTPQREYFEKMLPQVDADADVPAVLPAGPPDARREHDRPALPGEDAGLPVRAGLAAARAPGRLRTSVVPNVYDFNYLGAKRSKQVPRSALAGEVIYGNNHGKQSLDKTYLADALGTGNVTIRTLTRVTTIHQQGKGYLVGLEQIDAWGKVVRRSQISCGALFLGAGSIGTTELLLRARETGTLPDLPAAIGAGWGTNGNVMTARANHLWDPTGSLQSTIPTLAIDNWNDPVHPSFAEIAPLPGRSGDLGQPLPRDHGQPRARPLHLRPQHRPRRPALGRRPEHPVDPLGPVPVRQDQPRHRYDVPARPVRRQPRIRRRLLLPPARRLLLGKATDNYGRVRKATRTSTSPTAP